MTLPKDLIDLIEKAGFSICQEDENIYNFGKYSPAGNDFHFSVGTEDNLYYFLENIYAVYNEFDVSSETYPWLDESGHGKDGAPHDMKDAYEDMEACQEYINELYVIVKNYIETMPLDKKSLFLWICENYKIGNNHMVRGLLQNILDFTDDMNRKEKYQFLRKVLPWIPEIVIRNYTSC